MTEASAEPFDMVMPTIAVGAIRQREEGSYSQWQCHHVALSADYESLPEPWRTATTAMAIAAVTMSRGGTLTHYGFKLSQPLPAPSDRPRPTPSRKYHGWRKGV
jgi:hypothetical protein